MAGALYRERTKARIVEAARGLVDKEGAAKLTARALGEAAGISYAAIYNYFDDLDHMLWHVMMGYVEDIVRKLERTLGERPIGIAEAKAAYRAYADYFISNPKAFELIFCTRLGRPPADIPTSGGRRTLASLILAKLDAETTARIGGSRERESLASIITATAHGILLMHFAGKDEGGPASARKKIDEALDYLLGDLSK